MNIFFLSASLVSKGGVDSNGDNCSTLSFKFQLAYACAVYGVDVLGDTVALYWGRIVGFHAKDYDSAKFEGLERVHGYTTLLPVGAYIGASVTWMNEAGYPEGIETKKDVAIWVSYGLAYGTILFTILHDIYYDYKYVPGWSCKRCNWSWICHYCYRNKGPVPAIGPVWGGAGAASCMIGKLFLTIAEACSVWFLESVEFASLFIVLLALDILLIGVQWYSERKQPSNLSLSSMADIE